MLFWGGDWFFKIFEKRGVQIFPINNGAVGKIGGVVVFKKKKGGGVIFLWVFSVCVLFIYTMSISTICASQEKPHFIATNQQIYDFYKLIIWKRKDIVKSKFSIYHLM